MGISSDITRSQLDTLLKVSTALTSSLELSDVLQAAIDGAVDVLSLDTGAIYLVEENTMVLGATTPPLPAGFPEEYRTAALEDHPHGRRCLETGETVIIPDWELADLTPAERGVGESRGLRSIFFVPIASDEGPIGLFIVGTTAQTRAFTPTDESLCRTLSHQVALAVTNARLYASLHEANVELENARAELLKNNETLAGLNEELREASEVKDKFLALMSHELRTPLTVINGYLNFILNRGFGDPGPELREILSVMKEQGKNQLKLIEDLLNLSQPGKESFSLDREPCQPRELVDKVVQAFRPIQEEKTIQMDLDLEPDLPTVYWDRQKMIQVLQNLVENALKFTSPGGRITVSARTGTDFIELRVADNGIGIPQASVDKVFDRFYQVDSTPTRHHGGSGLGLAFVREIVHAHGGEVHVESEEEKGSTFLVRIPPGRRENAPPPARRGGGRSKSEVRG